MTAQEAPAVNILILGGLTHLARPLLCHLVHLSADEKPSVRWIRVVDKYLVHGQASTTYMDPETLAALEDKRVEYRQMNLNIASTASSAFDLPDDERFDFVFDLTGEGISGPDVPHQLLQERTTKLAGILASAALDHQVRAYIRDTPPFWTDKMEDGLRKESTNPGKSMPKSARAYYYYEAERAVANVEGLPLVLLRSAALYGPHQYYGYVSPRLALGEVYKHLNEPMKMLWWPDLRINTVHTRDWCRAAWKAAIWCSQRSRAEANEEAGEDLHATTLKDVSKFIDVSETENTTWFCPRSKVPRAPLFNVVDEDDINQGSLLSTVGQVYDIPTGFTNVAINTWAKLNPGSVVEDMNEKHAEAFTALNGGEWQSGNMTPLSCHLYPEDVAPRAIALDGQKIRSVLDWRAQERMSKASLEEVVESFKNNGAWGELGPGQAMEIMACSQSSLNLLQCVVEVNTIYATGHLMWPSLPSYISYNIKTYYHTQQCRNQLCFSTTRRHYHCHCLLL